MSYIHLRMDKEHQLAQFREVPLLSFDPERHFCSNQSHWCSAHNWSACCSLRLGRISVCCSSGLPCLAYCGWGSCLYGRVWPCRCRFVIFCLFFCLRSYGIIQFYIHASFLLFHNSCYVSGIWKFCGFPSKSSSMASPLVMFLFICYIFLFFLMFMCGLLDILPIRLWAKFHFVSYCSRVHHDESGSFLLAN